MAGHKPYRFKAMDFVLRKEKKILSTEGRYIENGFGWIEGLSYPASPMSLFLFSEPVFIHVRRLQFKIMISDQNPYPCRTL